MTTRTLCYCYCCYKSGLNLMCTTTRTLMCIMLLVVVMMHTHTCTWLSWSVNSQRSASAAQFIWCYQLSRCKVIVTINPTDGSSLSITGRRKCYVPWRTQLVAKLQLQPHLQNSGEAVEVDASTYVWPDQRMNVRGKSIPHMMQQAPPLHARKPAS
jgi:hypothetical protein